MPLGRLGADAVEWHDAGRYVESEIDAFYGDLERINRSLGGYRASRRALEPHIGAGIASLLDVAAGDGAFAEYLVLSDTLERGTRAIVLDMSAASLHRSRARADGSLAPVRGDALALPFRSRSIDLVHSALFLHHLSTPHACRLVSEMCRVSRKLVVVNDLVRSVVAWGSIWALGRAVYRHRLTRHDGPLSVRKAFVPREVEAIARFLDGGPAPGFRWRVETSFPYRMTLVGVRVEP